MAGLRTSESSTLRNLEQPLRKTASCLSRKLSQEKSYVPVIGLDGKKYDFEMIVTSN